MAVEARYFNLFPSQILSNQDLVFCGAESMNNLYGFSPVTTETMTPMTDFPTKADRGISYNNMKTLLGEDFSDYSLLKNLQLDRFITHHMEKVRLELEERRKIYSRRVIASVGESLMKRLKSKDEEIQRLRKINLALEERLKSIYIENQIWSDLAQTNEATANTLRSNLEQVLAIVQDDNSNGADDAESCCGSSNELTEKDVRSDGRVCRSCGKEEASVLLLPCRHLCLCPYIFAQFANLFRIVIFM